MSACPTPGVGRSSRATNPRSHHLEQLPTLHLDRRTSRSILAYAESIAQIFRICWLYRGKNADMAMSISWHCAPQVKVKTGERWAGNYLNSLLHG
jgi:hypothetical protein